MPIYLDHNAGAPLRPEAAEAISRFIAERAGNPSSVHRAGQRARRMLELARSQAGAIFHIDAAQAVGRISVDINALGCDLMTLSGHKLGAPAGIGALYIRDSAQFASSIFGGPQESGRRAGTPNLLGAIAFGGAAK